MPTADRFEADQGQPFDPVLMRSVTEALDGNGIASAGDLQTTATTTDLQISVAAGTVFYNGSSVSLNSAPQTFTLTAGDGTYDRWDTVYFDAATGDAGVREGTPAQYPTAPDITGDEVLVAIVYVEQNATDVQDADILNWRAKFPNKASKTQYADSTGTYGVNNVAAALDELQEAAQIGAYPLSLATDTEASAYPLANADLANSSLTVTAGTALAGGGSISLGGSATLDVSGVTTTEITDGTLLDADIDPTTTISRGKLDDERVTTAGVTASTATSGEEVLLVDTSSGAVTITLASADASTGNFVTVVDAGGSAGTNAITVDTESTETIDGGSSATIETNYSAQVFVSDGTNWFTAGGGGSGGGYDRTVDIDAAGGKTGIASGNQIVIIEEELADAETLEVVKARLSKPGGQPVVSSVTLDLVTFDGSGGYTSQTEIFLGDGSTVFESTGSPLASYTNSTGGAQQVGVLVDNQNASAADAFGMAKGEIT